MARRRSVGSVTMQDVARQAGVSQSTVSFVLNEVDGIRIGDATRARVRRIAEEMGYKTRPIAAHERGQRHPSVGMLLDEIATGPLAALLVEGAHEAAWALGRTLVVARSGGQSDLEDAVLENWHWQGVEGVVYATIFTRAVQLPARLSGTPSVLVNCHSDDPRLASVVPAEVMGGFSATRALIDAGHTRIAFINGEAWMEAAQDRLEGYRKALTTSGIAFDPDLVRQGDFLTSSGHRETVALLDLPNPPTAIFCANDLMALGCYEALKERGYRIPSEMSVMGYDDQEIAQHLFPALSTVLLPHQEMGRWATDYLITTQRAGQSAPPHLKLECPLVLRDSIGPPRGATPKSR